MNIDLAKHLRDRVRDFYEQQGAWFATTREKIIPEQEFAQAYVRDGMTVVDIGAGNGRLAAILPKNIEYIGVEPSQKLREHADANVIEGSLPNIPLPDQTSDITCCLAVLHHIPTHEERQQSVEELIRLTKPGGFILATSWLRHPHHNKMMKVEGGEAGDRWIPWTDPEGKTSERFVHFMQPGEWETLWSRPELEIVRIGMHGKQSWVEHEEDALNWRVIARRR